jgi:hypothetical protein
MRYWLFLEGVFCFIIEESGGEGEKFVVEVADLFVEGSFL